MNKPDMQKTCSEYQVGEVVQVNHERYRGTGKYQTYEAARPRMIGVILQHGEVRWYEADTVSKIGQPTTPRPSPEVAPMQDFLSVCDNVDCNHPYCWSQRTSVPAVAPRETQPETQPTRLCADCYAPIWSTPNGWRDRLSYRCHSREDGGHRPGARVEDNAPARVELQCPYCGEPILDEEEDGGYTHMSLTAALKCPNKYPTAQPVEGPRRKVQLSGDPLIDATLRGLNQDDCEFVPAPVEGVERVTDDRTADTIPTFQRLTEILVRDYGEEEAAGYLELIHSTVHRTGRAETRIEVLEVALRGLLVSEPIVSCNDFDHRKKDQHDGLTPCPALARWNAAIEVASAALDAPSGDTK